MTARVSLARYGAMIGVLWAAHDLADHVVQTDHQAANKATSWPAMAGHVGSYTAVQIGAVVALSAVSRTRLHWPCTAAAVALSAVTHAFLDRRWPVRRALELTRSPGFAGMTAPLHGPYLADQSLHHAVLAFCAALLAVERTPTSTEGVAA